MKAACDESCIHNNLSGIDCYTDCDSCVSGVEECPEACYEDCGDCLCCFCDNAPEDTKEFVCKFVGELVDCEEGGDFHPEGPEVDPVLPVLPCGCEESEVSFCNYDEGVHCFDEGCSFCEDCSNFENSDSCFNDNLP